MSAGVRPAATGGSALAAAVLRAAGWRLDPAVPAAPRYVLIAAPHTSNWDFPVAMLARAAIGLPCTWVGKHTLFRGPLGVLMRALGGVPVHRGAGGFVASAIEMFAARERLVLGLSPEGTRRHTPHWRSGFYRIAVEANVPIALAYIDHGRRRMGIGPLVEPSGDIERDFETFRAFYADKRGRHPEREGAIETGSG